MPRFRISADDTIELWDGAMGAQTRNALDQLKAAVEAAAISGATLRQNQQPGFSDVWRVTLPTDTAKSLFRLGGGDALHQKFGI